MRKGKQVKVYADPLIAQGFKEYCGRKRVSMSSLINEFMAERAQMNGLLKEKPGQIETRRLRRKLTEAIIALLRSVRDAEESYKDRIPENLSGSSAYENAETAIDLVDEAIAALEEAYA